MRNAAVLLTNNYIFSPCHFQGRIVNNNTVPSGAASSAILPSKSPPVSSTPSSRIHQAKDNATNGQKDYYHVQTQFLIHEEGGLERWFNLTITNVGVESVADYTCVAVNAGGVMEENISLTFEEPEPVSAGGHFFQLTSNCSEMFSKNECTIILLSYISFCRLVCLEAKRKKTVLLL